MATGVIVPATVIDDMGSCEMGNGVEVGVWSVPAPSAVEVGTVGVDDVAVLPRPMAVRMPGTPVWADPVDPTAGVDGLVAPDDDPAVEPPTPAVVAAPPVAAVPDVVPPDVLRPLLVGVAAVAADVGEGVGLVVACGTFTI
jgi:hypothetical protein